MAEKIVEYFSKKKEYKQIIVAKPGFINLRLSNNFYHKKLISIYDSEKKYGSSKYGKRRK